MMNIYAILLLFTLFIDQQYPTTTTNYSENTIDKTLFCHGVASGDPLADRVIIWTRVTPKDSTQYQINWQVAMDVKMKNIIAKGIAKTTQQQDYTVKVDVTGLTANTAYYYQFETSGKKSIIGRTKTAPKDNIEHLRFGVVSCNNYQDGYFNAFSAVAKRPDLDAVIHLGDYIYEYGEGQSGHKKLNRRLSPITEIIDLADYRMRYSLYRLDEGMIKVHQQHPFICIWDDHEVANDSYKEGAQNHQSHEGDWQQRKKAAKQAYFEWLPIRNHPEQKINRVLNYGNLIDLILLDTRLEGRTKQPKNTILADDSSQTMLGTQQQKWLFNALKSSKAQWKIIGQQVIFSELNVGWINPFNRQKNENRVLDIWDGYTNERSRIIDFIRVNHLKDVVFLTGDFHSSFAFEVADNPTNPTAYNPKTSKGAVAVEFVTPSITSANFDEFTGGYQSRMFEKCLNKPCGGFPFFYKKNPNPHIKYTDLDRHGYYILDVTKAQTQVNFYYMEDILTKNETEYFGTAWFTKSGKSHLELGNQSLTKPNASALAPITIDSLTNNWLITGIHPKLEKHQVFVQCMIQTDKPILVELYNAKNQKIRTLLQKPQPNGIFTFSFNSKAYPKGQYQIVVKEDLKESRYFFKLEK